MRLFPVLALSVLLLVVAGPVGPSAAATRICKKVETGERRVYAIHALGVSCTKAREVARVGWSVSPPGWRCSVNERTQRYKCVRRKAVVTFNAIGSD